ncbi:PmoA family protein [Leifsonia sp. NPDC058248]|uniref:DUF6807 domain-containing protein n=1 Tax=Leifsonia sp. NPDC058248 TaxID=3346402 RepID=UPI0036D9BA58
MTEAGPPFFVGFGEQTFFEYRPDAEPRPYIGALYSSDGIRVTRDIATAPADSDDHLHHKGVWWGHRDVNGADVWTEFVGHGRIVSIAPAELTVHGDVAQIVHSTRWVDADGTPLLDDMRVLRASAPRRDGSQTLDIESTMHAAYGPVVLGDTKEAALVAVRVAPAIEERRGGRIELSSGAVGSADSWGAGSDWCDYSGTIDGVTVGAAIFDHPDNPLAARWHVRDYGLMAVNPFGLSDFTGDSTARGALPLEPGSPLVFRYRVLVHHGDAHAADVAGHHSRYLDELWR